MVAGSVGAAALVLVTPGPPPQPAAKLQAQPDVHGAWLDTALAAVEQGQTTASPVLIPLEQGDGLYGQPAQWHLVALGLGDRVPTLAAVACLTDRQGPQLKKLCDRLVLCTGLIAEFELRQMQQAMQEQMAHLRTASELLEHVHRSPKFRQAAMAFCNELASRFDLERVSLGVRRGPYIRLVAASSTEQLNRKMDYVQLIEAAMEESADQQDPVIYPPVEGVDTVSQAAGKLAHHVNAGAVCALPLISDEKVEMVLALEADTERMPSVAALRSIRMTFDQVGPTLLRHHKADRWIGAKVWAGTRQLAAAVVGPRHTWIKLIVIAVLALALFLIFAKGTYRVEAPFVVEPAKLQIIDAPFDGTLEAVRVEPGDEVGAGAELAGLRTTELQLELLSLKADRGRYAREADLAMRENREADRQITLARRDQIDAQIARLESDLERAVIRSPITGVVVAGDLLERVGGTIQRGEVLFQVMPQESLRASVMVDEDQVNDVRLDASGWLSPASDPSLRLPIRVERVAPMAQVEEASNVFPVRVQLESRPAWLAPGMEGVARIEVRQERYAWIWTREARNWIRMKLWW